MGANMVNSSSPHYRSSNKSIGKASERCKTRTFISKRYKIQLSLMVLGFVGSDVSLDGLGIEVSGIAKISG